MRLISYIVIKLIDTNSKTKLVYTFALFNNNEFVTTLTLERAIAPPAIIGERSTPVEKIIDNDGKIFQSELSRIEGIGKLKSHRIIQRLSDRDVIEIEKHGKTNIIKLKNEIKESLIK